MAAPGGDAGRADDVVAYHSASIRRPVDVVARYLFDPMTMPQWSAVLYEIERTHDLEPRLGRRLRANLKILGVRVTVEGELVDVDPEARCATVRIVPADGDGALEHRLAVEPSGDGSSVVHFWNRIDLPSWLSGTLGNGVVGSFVDHTAEFALANIKVILEHGEEDNLRRLDRIANRDLPPPQRFGPATD